VRRRLLVPLLATAGLTVLGPVSAAAGTIGLAEVRDASGTTLARAGAGAFAFGRDSTVRVRSGAVAARPRRVVLRGVSLLGGRVRAARVVVPARGLVGARVDGLVVDGRAYSAGPNTLVPLGRGGYLVALQQAVAPGNGSTRTGVVGLRVHVGAATRGLPAGAELWVGIAAGARATATAAVGEAAEIPARLVPLYRRAARRYGVPWTALAAINRAETAFGANLGVSSAGAVGWMQFLPATWRRWGVDGNGDGRRDPWDPEDAIPAAARYLAAAGARQRLAAALWSYNHSDAYVRSVLADIARYDATPGARPGPLDPAALGWR
jgi:hypothetical protein